MQMRARRLDHRPHAHGFRAVLTGVALSGMFVHPVPAETGAGYLISGNSGVVIDGYADCVRTGQWDADEAHPRCNPEQLT